jgi:Skp family chaperone for outer membrane proteins
MKTTSPSAKHSSRPAKFSIVDKLVFMLAAALFGVWILGTFFLNFFPAGASASESVQSAALVADGHESSEPTDNSAATAPQSSDDAIAAASGAGSSNASNATNPFNAVNGSSGNSNRNESGEGFASAEKSRLEQKINQLQEQLQTKSQELTQLQKTSMEAAKLDSKANAAAAKYEKQIDQLAQQKDRLDQKIKQLNSESKTQKTEIQRLQDQLAANAEAKPEPAAEAMASIDAEDSAVALGGDRAQNQPLEFRDWISSKGNKARLAFVRWEDDGIVVVNEADKEFRLTLERLSPQDQNYVNSKR